ncbi:MAG: head GIN domain-containing protein [Flavobacteriales bacterium]
MKNLIYLFAVLLAVGCNKPDAPDCFQSSGKDASEVRIFDGAVKKIEHFDLIDVVLVPGDENSCVVKAPSNLMPEIITSFNNGVLTIENKNTCNFVRSYKKDFIVEVQVGPEFNAYQFEGQGNVTCTDTLSLESMEMEVYTASGDVDLWLNAEEVKCFNHTGVANLRFVGNAESAEWFHQGFGTFDASSLRAETVLSNSNSVNRLRLFANSYLYAVIQASGNVYYRGNPEVIDLDRSGEGELLPIN